MSKILFLTDSISEINGMSVFSNIFKNWLINQTISDIVIVELKTSQINYLRNASDSFEVELVYVNGHFSSSDLLIRDKKLAFFLSKFGLTLSKSCHFILISHGWQKMKFRLNYYSLIYNIRNLYKTLTIDKIKRHYNELFFISNKIDSYRHYDLFWCKKKNIKYNFNNFAKAITLGNPSLDTKISVEDYILVISNFDIVKNLFFLFRVQLNYYLKNKPSKKYVLLTTRPKSLRSRVVLKCLFWAKIKVEFDQSLKWDLIYNCNYLFIPSFTEYLPLVALEAFSFSKKVLSLYFINGLSDYNDYHFLKK
jgi:hypothetical protein